MDFRKKIPSYLLDRGNIVRLVLFTAAFALVFINIYSPFGVNNYFKNYKLGLLLYSSLVILTGVLVVVISRIVMYQITRKGISISLGHFLIWVAAEIVFMSLFYALYEIIILKDHRSFQDAIQASILNTSLVLLIPYSTLWLYFSWRDKTQKLKLLYGSHRDEPVTKSMILFRDDKGVMRFSLKIDDLLYLKGAENYVTIYYHDQNKHASFLLRTTLKHLEEELKTMDIIRCHRSYMVNFAKVKLIEREKDGLRIKLDCTPVVELPVSKTYVNDVFQLFGQLP